VGAAKIGRVIDAPLRRQAPETVTKATPPDEGDAAATEMSDSETVQPTSFSPSLVKASPTDLRISALSSPRVDTSGLSDPKRLPA